jgi:Xaa-Pro aminopeptidase
VTNDERDAEFEAFMLGGWERLTRPVLRSPLAPPATCDRRRASLSAAFPGQTVVVPSGRAKNRANDIEHPFRSASDFVWLSGWDEPGAVLLMAPTSDGHSTTLFLPPRFDRSTTAFYANRQGEAWVGQQPRLEEVGSTLAVFVRPTDALPEALSKAKSVKVRRGIDPALDAMVDEPDDDVARAVAMLRLRKDRGEVAALRSAISTTVRGFEDVVRELPPVGGVTERWLEAAFVRRARCDANDTAYPVIAAGGAHACVLHWAASHSVVRGDDLLLLDAGAESRLLYAADVTRTLPVSGRFSPVQREVYDVVCAAHDAAVAECRPGNDFLAPHRAATAVTRGWLEQSGLIERRDGGDDGRHVRFTVHRTSHMLGLDVHDCSAVADTYVSGKLEPGMVLTVEPGCYIQRDDLTAPEPYRGIGVRIEDDVLITESGCEVLSAELPTKAAAVEDWMAALRTG